jgi:hypothetical protein
VELNYSCETEGEHHALVQLTIVDDAGTSHPYARIFDIRACNGRVLAQATWDFMRHGIAWQPEHLTEEQSAHLTEAWDNFFREMHSILNVELPQGASYE